MVGDAEGLDEGASDGEVDGTFDVVEEANGYSLSDALGRVVGEFVGTVVGAVLKLGNGDADGANVGTMPAPSTIISLGAGVVSVGARLPFPSERRRAPLIAIGWMPRWCTAWQ